MEICEKSQFWSTFAKISILVEILENLDFRRNLGQILVLDEIFENLDFGRNFPEIEFLSNFFLKLRIWPVFSKNPHISRNFEALDFNRDLQKISILI